MEAQAQAQDRSDNKKMLAVCGVLLIVVAALVWYLFFRGGALSPSLVVADVQTSLGSEAYVSVRVVENPGMAGFVISVEYDPEQLQPTDLVRGGVISDGGIFSSNYNGKNNDGLISVAWLDVQDINDDGELFAVRFRPVGDAGTTPVSVSYKEGNIPNEHYEAVALAVKNGSVTIK